jgi:hypothetical protein
MSLCCCFPLPFTPPHCNILPHCITLCPTAHWIHTSLSTAAAHVLYVRVQLIPPHMHTAIHRLEQHSTLPSEYIWIWSPSMVNSLSHNYHSTHRHPASHHSLLLWHSLGDSVPLCCCSPLPLTLPHCNILPHRSNLCSTAHWIHTPSSIAAAHFFWARRQLCPPHMHTDAHGLEQHGTFYSENIWTCSPSMANSLSHNYHFTNRQPASHQSLLLWHSLGDSVPLCCCFPLPPNMPHCNVLPYCITLCTTVQWSPTPYYTAAAHVLCARLQQCPPHMHTAAHGLGQHSTFSSENTWIWSPSMNNSLSPTTTSLTVNQLPINHCCWGTH